MIIVEIFNNPSYIGYANEVQIQYCIKKIEKTICVCVERVLQCTILIRDDYDFLAEFNKTYKNK